MFYILSFHTKFLKCSELYFSSTSLLGLATFQGLNSHVWLVATISLSSALGCELHVSQDLACLVICYLPRVYKKNSAWHIVSTQEISHEWENSSKYFEISAQFLSQDWIPITRYNFKSLKISKSICYFEWGKVLIEWYCKYELGVKVPRLFVLSTGSVMLLSSTWVPTKRLHEMPSLWPSHEKVLLILHISAQILTTVGSGSLLGILEHTFICDSTVLWMLF